MMRFDVNVVLEKSDLIQYVTMAGGNPTQDNPHRFSSHCPLHGGDNTSAFSIFYKEGRWHWNCFTGNCGGGDAIRFIEKWQGLKFLEACEWIMGERITDLEGLKVSAEQRLEQARLEEIAAKERKEARLLELQRTEKHLQYHLARKGYQWAIEMWNQRGLDEGMQDWFYLGAMEDFTYWHKGQEYHSPTLTIPCFDEDNKVLQIQHRLINPAVPNNKYRPDVIGVDSSNFLAVPPMGYDGEIIIAVEGYIKAMVTWTKVNIDIQVVGVPALNQFPKLIERLKDKGKKVIIIRDPVTGKERKEDAMKPIETARVLGAKLITPPVSIDDYINTTKPSNDQFYSFLKQARKV